MKRIFALSISISLLAALLIAGFAWAGATKVDVCHFDKDSGVFFLINISENAFQAHVDHGDAEPGDAVPGMPGYIFASDCTPVNALDVSGSWRGQSGISGTMGYWFNMSLSQDASGNVTGDVYYDIGIHRTVTGSLSGYAFTFVTHDNPTDPTAAYWADCNPCTVSVTGTHFDGYGTSSSGQNIEFDANKP